MAITIYVANTQLLFGRDQMLADYLLNYGSLSETDFGELSYSQLAHHAINGDYHLSISQYFLKHQVDTKPKTGVATLLWKRYGESWLIEVDAPKAWRH